VNDRRSGHGDEGIALIIVTFFAIIGIGLVIAGTTRLKAAVDKDAARIAVQAHAAQLAKAGLVEGMSWLQRQASQPVLTFAPVLDESSDPPIRETLDPDIGLVREIVVAGNLWGRYELWKQWDDDPDAKRRAIRQRLECRDVSAELGLSPGRVWRLKCRAIVYRKRAEDRGPFEPPNQVVASFVWEGEVRQSITVTPPAQGAIVTERADTVLIESGAQIQTQDGVTGIVYSPGTGVIDNASADVTTAAAPTPLDLGFESVFGVSFMELRLNADLNVTKLSDLPDELREGTITILEAPGEIVKVNYQKHLQGHGVLVVDAASLEFAQHNMSDFSGILYVTGDITLGGPLWIRGMIIARGAVTVSGSQDVTVAYNTSVVETTSKGKGYRRRRKPFATTKGAVGVVK